MSLENRPGTAHGAHGVEFNLGEPSGTGAGEKYGYRRSSEHAAESRFGPASWNYYETNPALLGGIRIQRGNSIWDGSIWGRLARLEVALS